ncbi:MAG TPA: ferredoxin [Clostridiales bacterium]|nr:ferredoxin [Clostridiales bacterium]
MKAYVDPDICTGCGLCEDACASVFSLNDDGIAVAIEDELEGDVLKEAEDARDQCPVEAIEIKD